MLISAIGGSIILTKAWEVFSFQGFSQRHGEHVGKGRIGKIIDSKIIFLGIARRALERRLYERRDFRYTPDSANSTERGVFKFAELFHFLAAHTNASSCKGQS